MRRFLFIIPLLLTTLAFGAEPQSYPPEGQMVFKGLDTKSSPTQLQDGRAQDLNNVQFTTTFALKKRKGYSLVNSELLDIPSEDYAAITGIYYNKYSDGTEYIYTTEGDKLYYSKTATSIYYPGNTVTWTHISSPTITAGNNNQFVFTSALDTVIATNDVDKPIEITKTPSASLLDLTDLGSDAPTKVKCIAWFQNFLVLGNTVENGIEKPTRIRWSNIGKTETWTEADRNDISELSGQEINAFAQLYDDLYIFLTDSVWKMSHVGGDEQFKFTKVLNGIGCIAKSSVQNIILQNSQRGLMFLTKNKELYFFNGVTAVYASEIIEPTMDLLNASRLEYSVSEDNGTEYRLYTTTGTDSTNNIVIVYNYRIGEWSKFDQIDINAVARVVDSDGVSQSYAGNYTSAVLKLDVSTLNSDIYGATGTLTAVGTLDSETASGVQVLYDSTASFTTSGLTGAIIRITGGTGQGQESVIVSNTTTGIMVYPSFSTTPDITSSYSVGDINAYYETKDYDCGDAAKLKSFGELYIWAEEQGNVTLDLSYKQDFGSIVETQTVSENGGGGVWGTGVWGTATWGGYEALLARVKLKKEARYISFKISEDDIDETFKLYGYNILYWPRKYW